MKAILPSLLPALAIMLAAAVPADAEPFEDGVAAAERGDYETALRIWRPLAEQGDAEAQYNLGFSYANGESVPQDFVQAHLWLSLAASAGLTCVLRDHKRPQYAL